MRLNRRATRSLSGWLTALLLFVQVATAAYACPAVAAAVQVPAAMAEMAGCEPTPASAAPATPVLLAVLDWTHAQLLPAQPAAGMAPVTYGASPPGSPPLYLRLLVLRN